MTDAILWITRTGVQWRNLDLYFPKWQSVYYYIRKWTLDGTFQRVMSRLSSIDRVVNSRKELTSLLAVDNQKYKISKRLKLIKTDRNYRGIIYSASLL